MGEDDSDNESVQSQGFSEDEDQDHSHEDGLLLGIGTHSGISHDSNGKSGSQRGQTAAKAG